MLEFRLSVIAAVLVLTSSLALPRGSFQITQEGLLFTVDDFTGTDYVGLHYSVDKPLPGVTAGDFNFDIRTKTDGKWQHVTAHTSAKLGSVINYWMVFITTHGGVQETDLSYTIPGTTSTTKHTTPTTKSTTQKTTKKTTPHTTTDPGTHNMTTDVHNTTTPTPSHHTTPQPGPDSCSTYPCVVFEDEFDELNLRKWQHELTASGGGNWEFEVYVNNRSNSYAKDGKLFIKPTLTADIRGEAFLSSGLLDIWGQNPPEQCTANQFYGCFRQGSGTNYINPVQSARIRSSKSFNFRYGKVEVEAKMPAGDWLWPAVWMLPIDNNYGLWPASGEIDILESRGNANYRDSTGKQIGNKMAAQTLHWGPYFEQNQYKRTHVEKVLSGGSFADSFHKFAVEWDDSQIVFSIDGEETVKIDPGKDGFWGFGEFDKNVPGSFNPWKAGHGGKMAPFDQEFYLIMNLAVGGTNGFFPPDAVNQGGAKPWNDKSQTANRDFWNAKNQWYPTWKDEEAALQINYIRVTKMKPDP